MASIVHSLYNMLTEEPFDEIIEATRDSVMALRKAFGTTEKAMS